MAVVGVMNLHDDEGQNLESASPNPSSRDEIAPLAERLLQYRETGTSLAQGIVLAGEALDEIGHLRAVIRKAARHLYMAEVHRQGVGWDDYCTGLLVRSQHDLAAETQP